MMLAQAQGGVNGTITADTGAAVADAVLTAEGTGITARTGAEGDYRMELPPGAYTISIEHPEYAFETIDVEISSGETVTRDVELAGMQMLQMEEVKVTATHMKGSLPAFMEEERASPEVVDALSAEQMSRAGDTYVTDGLKRVTGLTLVEDKYVYVRGLGERYSSVLLNGARLSSTDPTRRVMELDFIPGDVLEGIVVQKSYSPDIPASFGGGTIIMRSQSYPEEFFARFSASTAYRPDTTFEDGKTYEGSDTDFLGIDDGLRDLPGSVPSKQNFGQMSPAERESVGEDFEQIYNVEDETVPPDFDLAASIGNQYRPGDGKNKFGYLGAFRYGRSWHITEQDWRTFNRSGGIIHDWNLDWNDDEINLGAFLNLGAAFGENHKFGSTTMLIRDTLDSTRIRQGYNADWDEFVERTALIWLERQMFNQQITGRHDFPGAADLGLDWQYTYSKGDREEPDRREYLYEVGDEGELFLPLNQSNNNSREWSDMSDTTHDASFDLSLPVDLFKETRLKAGAKWVDKSRDFEMRRFTLQGNPFNVDPGILNQDLEEILNDAHIHPEEFVLTEVTRPSDTYDAEQTIFGYYGMADMRVAPIFGLTGGLRYESSEQEVNSFGPNGEEVTADLDVDDVFPAVSATWFVGGTDETTVRLAFSQTVNRPDFKELSTAEYTDPVTGLLIEGNPDLEQSDIQSYDIRFEHFFSPYENVALSLFYKTFDNPIEQFRKVAADETSSFLNTNDAENYGIEIEALKYLDFIEGWEHFFVGGNLALIESEVTIPEGQKGLLTNDKRPLQGQSDFIVNLNFGYENLKKGIVATLLYNISGEYISELGTFGRDDIYRQPASRLDFVYRQEFADNWKFKFEAENLLDPEIEYEQGGKVTRNYEEGRKFSVGIDYTFH
jgi:TonB-dependent receptor